MKILIADNDSDIIEDVSRTLNINQPDWQVSVIGSGKRCLDILTGDNSPDAIITGIQLTDMSGFELVGRIRDNSDIPVIVVSRDTDIQRLVEAFDAGANDYIVRPFNKAIFIAV
jgi:two-component system KDP operon response regulator KdpE